jgi:UDP-N-acetylmuramyl pentapeptide phosphotransferase/UDP-N-acetylglucosamine-1-phosphate transferase
MRKVEIDIHHMHMAWAAASLPLLVLVATLWLMKPVLGWLKRRAILDRPVERSVHRAPVPRGGGLVVVPAVLVAWLALALLAQAPPGTLTIVLAAAALAALSWRDDVAGLPIALRLAAHAVAVAVGLAALPPGVFQGLLPPLADRAAAGLLWLWFLNAYNFMDGIDGITGVETAAIGLGIALVAAARPADGDASMAALALAAGGLGFLRWNWHPAQIFMGDVGSIALGYLGGFLLLALAAHGLWAPAVILPLYYIADAGITMARRALAGERFWEAHRRHFYQRALAPDGDHAAVARIVLAGDLLLLALAVLAASHPWPALAAAAAVVAAMLALMERRPRRLG